MEHKDMIGYKIRLINNQIHKKMEEKRKENEGDLTGVQCWILRYIREREKEDVYQRDLEKEFKISRATASNILSILERKGLIERLPVAHDARLKKLVLTERARDRQQRAENDMRQMEACIVRGMSGAEAEQFKKALDTVLENLGVGPEDGLEKHTGCCGSGETK